jgi:heat shock protein 4
VAFHKSQLRVLSTAFANIGGRNFDQAIVDWVVDEFEKKYKGLDIRDNKKACYRLRLAAERAKKVLSANSNTVFAVESLTEDRDVSTKIERADFEEMIQPIINQILPCLQQALDAAGVTTQQVHKVEVVGGSGRIPAVRRTIATFFGDDLSPGVDPLTLKLSQTLNAEEAVSRGNALMCAMLSPVFKVREFGIQDWFAFPIKIEWDASLTDEPEEPASMAVFARGEKFPVSKVFPTAKSFC